MPPFKPPRLYRREADRFRQTARYAEGALQQDFDELADLYENLADFLERLGAPALSRSWMLN